MKKKRNNKELCVLAIWDYYGKPELIEYNFTTNRMRAQYLDDSLELDFKVRNRPHYFKEPFELVEVNGGQGVCVLASYYTDKEL